MPKYFSVLFLVLFSFTTFAQDMLSEYGTAESSGSSTYEPSDAPVVFLDQAPNQVNGLFADSNCLDCGSLQQSIADNFVAVIGGANVAITEIVMWGGYFPENIPNTTDDFTIILHDDAAGPGADLDVRTGLQPARATTGATLFGVDEYIFTFDFSGAPIFIPSAGTYWVEIFNNSVESSNFFWETGDNDPIGGIVGSAWITVAPGVPPWNLDGITDLAIQINGDDDISGGGPFSDDFDSYTAGGQLVAQNNIDWDTWTPGGGGTPEDPFVSNNFAYTQPNSVVVVQNNDFVRKHGDLTTGAWYMSFYFYIPATKSGYFNTLNEFIVPANTWGMDCYFDVGGTGRIDTTGGGGGGANDVPFTWAVGQWNQAMVVVDLDATPPLAEFWTGTDDPLTLVATWDWTQGGTKANSLAVNDFFGAAATDEMYMDNYVFDRLRAPTATTDPASDITLTTARLNGTVNPNAASTVVEFEYGTTTSYGNTITAVQSPIGGTDPVQLYADISGLNANQTYHFRVNATNSAGTSHGTDIIFNTDALAPIATTEPATNVDPSSAILNGNVNPNELMTTVVFEYGLTTSYGDTVVADQSPIPGGSSAVNVSAHITSLSLNTTYHFRVKATNSVGTTNGIDRSFTTSINYPDEISVSTSYSFGDFQQTSSYKIIGIPGDENLPISNYTTGTPGKENDWRAFRDPTGSGSYTEYTSGSSTFNFGKGRAFWVLSKSTLSISEEAVNTGNLDPVDNTYSITPLNNEWNLITNPFKKNIPWSDVQTVNGVTQTIKYFQSGSYSDPDQFEFYKGYYFFNITGLTSLKIPYISPGGSPLLKQQIEISEELEIILAMEGERKSTITIGFSEEAKPGVDKLDIFSPPSAFCVINLALFNEGLETNYKYLDKEYRAEIGEGQQFDIKLKNTTGKKLELITEEIGGFDEYEIYLLDKRLNKLYNLKEQNRVEVKRSVKSGDYSLLVGTEDYILQKKSNLLPEDYVLYQNYPNPFNPLTTIRFAMPKDGNVTLNVYNMLGELVTELIDNREYEAGYHEVEFDAGAVASGVYIYRVQAGEFVVAKKMILMK